MNLTRNGVTIEVADATIVEMVLQRLNGSTYPANLKLSAAPRIGAYWPGQGGCNAGIMRGDEGKPDYYLIHCAKLEQSSIQHDPAMKWAAGLCIDGHNDFALPTRREQRLLFANMSEDFKPEWYWSCEKLASAPSYAWVQNFLNGFQLSKLVDFFYRARAVRRIPIQ